MESALHRPQSCDDPNEDIAGILLIQYVLIPNKYWNRLIVKQDRHFAASSERLGGLGMKRRSTHDTAEGSEQCY